MHKYNYIIGFALILSLCSVVGHAADVNAGKAKSAMCAGCHGSDGNSTNPLWPSLAGQGAAYLETQLHNFKSGLRNNPMMKPMAEGLTDADVQNLAAYFAGLPAKAAGGDAALAKLGKDKTAMCMGCHGAKLLGQASFPRLAGQQSQYVLKQLQDYKSGARKAGPMNAVAQSLTSEDMQAIAAYLGTLTN